MDRPPLKTDSEGRIGRLLGYVAGSYRPPSGQSGTPAFLALYFNSDYAESPYSFVYQGRDGSWLGHRSPFVTDEVVERALLDAWWEFRLEPHFWNVLEPDAVVEDGSSPSDLHAEYTRRLALFRRVVDEFRLQWQARGMIYGDDEARYESDRLFYPDPPAEDWPPMEGFPLSFDSEEID